ncbi:uncharacterized protein LOC116412641 [Galleria mellonella]|uniref:Uncharacterized protein LOC116412641 n=1 Tax=Galleria mellonella TaxID=7137 RepID=A0A6J3BNF9_GALME|nr:uncharacterized protein LOC116412641 [Galleria mellonella]
MAKIILGVFICLISLFHVSHQSILYTQYTPTIGQHVGKILERVARFIELLFYSASNDDIVTLSEESYFCKLMNSMDATFNDILISASLSEDVAPTDTASESNSPKNSDYSNGEIEIIEIKKGSGLETQDTSAQTISDSPNSRVIYLPNN